jgi:hypothetical protein
MTFVPESDVEQPPPAVRPTVWCLLEDLADSDLLALAADHPDSGQGVFQQTSETGCQPIESRLDAAALRHRWQTARDHGCVNEAGTHQGGDEVLVFLAEGAELRDAEVFLIEAPAGELRVAG